MNLSPKAVAAIAILIGSLIGIYWIYESGVSDGKAVMQKQFDELNAKAEMLQQQVDNKTEKTVTEYVYRDRVIYKKQESLVGKVDAELKTESKDCRIGPAFVRLHNLSVDSK